jgi:hypothetical protein
LDVLVDLFNAPLGPNAEERSGSDTKAQSRKQPQRQYLGEDVRYLGQFVDASANRQDFAICHETGNGADGLALAAFGIESDDRVPLWSGAYRKAARQSLQIACNPFSIRTVKPDEPDSAKVLSQSFVDGRNTALRCSGFYHVRSTGGGSVNLADHFCGGLPIYEPEHQNRAKRKSAGYDERPTERGGPAKFRQAHG